jgi:hypothetical protein
MSEQTSTSEQRPPSNRRRKLAETIHIPADPLLDATAAAVEADLSLSAWWQAVASGRMPLPCYPTPRSPRWFASEIKAAVLRTRALPMEQAAERLRKKAETEKSARTARKIADGEIQQAETTEI